MRTDVFKLSLCMMLAVGAFGCTSKRSSSNKPSANTQEQGVVGEAVKSNPRDKLKDLTSKSFLNSPKGAVVVETAEEMDVEAAPEMRTVSLNDEGLVIMNQDVDTLKSLAAQLGVRAHESATIPVDQFKQALASFLTWYQLNDVPPRYIPEEVSVEIHHDSSKMIVVEKGSVASIYYEKNMLQSWFEKWPVAGSTEESQLKLENQATLAAIMDARIDLEKQGVVQLYSDWSAEDWDFDRNANGSRKEEKVDYYGRMNFLALLLAYSVEREDNMTSKVWLADDREGKYFDLGRKRLDRRTLDGNSFDHDKIFGKNPNGTTFSFGSIPRMKRAEAEVRAKMLELVPPAPEPVVEEPLLMIESNNLNTTPDDELIFESSDVMDFYENEGRAFGFGVTSITPAPADSSEVNN